MNGKTKLVVFDFDGTLVKTPEEEDGKKLYEEATGKSWVIENDEQALKNGFDKGFRRRGWWGRMETLLPPIYSRPATKKSVIMTVHMAWLNANDDKAAQKVLITGRHSKLKEEVEKILYELSMDMDEYFYKGMHPACTHPDYKQDTPGWKMFAILQLAMKPEYDRVTIFEDREDVVELFNTKMIEEFKTRWPQVVYVNIHDVKKKRSYFHPIKSCNLHVASELQKKAAEKMD